MKAVINKLLSPLGVELHGKGYMRKLANANQAKDAFESQQRLVKKAKTIFDVGANRGLITERYSHFYPGAAIHAFEPFGDFEQDFASRHQGNKKITWNKTALSDSVSTVDYFVNRSTDTNSLYRSGTIGAASDRSCATVTTVRVQTDTVDNYCATKGINIIDILKLDTQGSELAILKGAQRLLETKSIQLIYAEAFMQPQYEEAPLFFDIANYLKALDYYLEDLYEPYYNEKYLLWCDAIFLPKNK